MIVAHFAQKFQPSMMRVDLNRCFSVALQRAKASTGGPPMSEKERMGITPKSWTGQRHHGVLHLGKRWYVLSADIDDAGTAKGVRLDGPFADHETAEAQVERHHTEPFPPED